MVGVDQSQLFNVGSLSGYAVWTSYIDGIAYSPNPLISFSGVESTHTLYVTSQFIGGSNPTNTPIVTPFVIAN